MDVKIHDMPKLESPFVREMIDGKSLVTPKIRDGFRWVFTEEAEAVDKLDGSNVSIVREDGQIRKIFNRTTQIHLFTKGSKSFIEGIYNAIERDYLWNATDTGQIFGELIGPKYQGNPYKLSEHLWVPLNYLRGKYRFKFWEDFVRKELVGRTDGEIFAQVEKCFKNLWSIYKRARKVGGNIEDVTEDTGFEGLAAEGIVFYRKGVEDFQFNEKDECINICKLRRDMFSFYKGRRHEQG